MKLFGLSDKGIVRSANEDSFGIFDSENYCISVVCDGMGGVAGGQKASNLAKESYLKELKSILKKTTVLNTIIVKKAIDKAIEKANSDVFSYAEKHKKYQGMGCTLNSFVYLKKQSRLVFANVGDSRLYKFDSNELNVITVDHSYVRYLIDIGEINEEEAKTHPQKNLITRAVGIGKKVKADIYVKKTTDKNYYLSCTDGLYSMIDEEDLKDIVFADDDIKTKVEKLITLANKNGGVDNITGVLIFTEKEDAKR